MSQSQSQSQNLYHQQHQNQHQQLQSDSFNIIDSMSSSGKYTSEHLLDVYARLASQNQLQINNDNSTSNITSSNFQSIPMSNNDNEYRSSSLATPLIVEMNQQQSLLNKLSLNESNSLIGTPNLSSTSLNLSSSQRPFGAVGGGTNIGIGNVGVNDSLLMPMSTGVSTTATVGTDQYPFTGLSRSASHAHQQPQQQNVQLPLHDLNINSQWIYKDRQGEIRGPFDSQTMQAWYSAGYFPLELSIKNDDAHDWSTIQDLINQTNSITPFISYTLPHSNLHSHNHTNNNNNNDKNTFFNNGANASGITANSLLMTQLNQMNLSSPNNDLNAIENSPALSNVSLLHSNGTGNVNGTNGGPATATSYTTVFPSFQTGNNGKSFHLNDFGVEDDLSSRVNSMAGINEIMTNVPKDDLQKDQKEQFQPSKQKDTQIEAEVEVEELVNQHMQVKPVTPKPVSDFASVTESAHVSVPAPTSAAAKRSISPKLESVKLTPSASASASSIAPWATVKQKLPTKTLEEIQREEQLKKQQQKQKQEEKDRLLATRLALEESSNVAAAAAIATFPKTSTWATVNKPMKQTKSLQEIQREQLEESKLKAAKQSQNEILASQKQSFAQAIASDDSWTVVDKKVKQLQQSKLDSKSSTSSSMTPTQLRVIGSNSLTSLPPKSQSQTQTQTQSQSPATVSTATSIFKPVVAPSTSIVNTIIPSHAQKFLLWARSQMTGLYESVNMEDMLTIMLQLGVDSDAQEIIADTVYSNSSTMDGRRFAQEFLKRRREVDGIARSKGWVFEWSDAVKSTRGKKEIVEDEWESFTTVTKKGKKVKNPQF